MNLRTAEYSALRQTVSARGTTRIVIAATTITVWGVLSTALVLFSDLPLAVLVPFAVLVAGFEAVQTLHAGVERIGRYLQVSYEQGADAPQWETAAMAVGPALPGGGVDPLFSAVFVVVAVLNLAAALPVAPIWQELLFLGICHAGFVLRIVQARKAAARQRAVELEGFRAVLLRQHNRG